MPLNNAYQNTVYLNVIELQNSKHIHILKDLLGEKLENKNEDFEKQLKLQALES